MTTLIIILLIGLTLFTVIRLALPGGYPLDENDADVRRVAHDIDAIRTRFEGHPVWPSPGPLGERR